LLVYVVFLLACYATMESEFTFKSPVQRFLCLISQFFAASCCGTVLRIAKELAKDFSVDFAGVLLRPHSDWLTEDNAKTKKVLEAARQAGRQLVAEGKISKDLLTVISQPLTSKPKWWH